MTIHDRLARWTDRSGGPGACWPFVGCHDKNGYGTLWVGRWGPGTGLLRTSRAHRVAWVLSHGPIPEGLHVLHHCDNPPCVNPAHLFLGTNQDNQADMIRKGRQGWWPLVSARPRPGRPRGSRHGLAKLDEARVREIRALLGTLTGVDIARRYGVSDSAISNIRRGRTWGHVR